MSTTITVVNNGTTTVISVAGSTTIVNVDTGGDGSGGGAVGDIGAFQLSNGAGKSIASASTDDGSGPYLQFLTGSMFLQNTNGEGLTVNDGGKVTLINANGGQTIDVNGDIRLANVNDQAGLAPTGGFYVGNPTGAVNPGDVNIAGDYYKNGEPIGSPGTTAGFFLLSDGKGGFKASASYDDGSNAGFSIENGDLTAAGGGTASFSLRQPGIIEFLAGPGGALTLTDTDFNLATDSGTIDLSSGNITIAANGNAASVSLNSEGHVSLNSGNAQVAIDSDNIVMSNSLGTATLGSDGSIQLGNANGNLNVDANGQVYFNAGLAGGTFNPDGSYQFSNANSTINIGSDGTISLESGLGSQLTLDADVYLGNDAGGQIQLNGTSQANFSNSLGVGVFVVDDVIDFRANTFLFNGVPSPVIVSVTGSLTPDQLAHLGTSPVEVIPTPGPDKLIVLNVVIQKYIPGASRISNTSYNFYYQELVYTEDKDGGDIGSTANTINFTADSTVMYAYNGFYSSRPAPNSGVSLYTVLASDGVTPQDYGPRGGIDTSHIVTPGTGYSPGSVVSANAGDGTAQLTVDTVDGDGGIVTYTVIEPGHDYEVRNNVGLGVVSGSGNGDAVLSVDATTNELGTYSYYIEYHVVDVSGL